MASPVKPGTAGHMVEQSWVPLPPALRPVPLPGNGSCFVGTWVSSDKSPPSVKGPPFRAWKELPLFNRAGARLWLGRARAGTSWETRQGLSVRRFTLPSLPCAWQ